MMKHRSRFLVIQLILIFTISSLYNQNNSLGSIAVDDDSNYGFSNYMNFTVIQPVLINSNAEMDVYAENNNLAGNGTKNYPFVIDSVLINASNSDFAISLFRVDRYLTINSSYFFGGIINSVKTKEVANLYLFNNTIDRSQILTRYDCCENQGIRLEASANITLEQNLIEDTRIGISLNWMYSVPIFLNYQGNITLQNNTIHMVSNGIIASNHFGDKNTYRGNTIQYNFISDASSNGIYVQRGSENNFLFGNKLLNSSGLIINSRNNTISHNYVSFDQRGMSICDEAVNNRIINNTVNSFSFAISICKPGSVENNSILFNNFISPIRAVTYAADKLNNVFDKNFYSDHDLTDTNEDGITDSDYRLGYQNIYDNNPLAYQNTNSFESLNLNLKVYPGFNETIYSQPPTTSTSFTSSTTSTTNVPTTTEPSTSTTTIVPTTIESSTSISNLETITVTKMETTSKSEESSDIASSGPTIVGNSNQFIFLIFTLAVGIKLKRRD